MIEIKQGSILKSSFWSEKVKVMSTRNLNEHSFKIEAIELETNQFCDSLFFAEQLKKSEVVEEKRFRFLADGESLFLILKPR